MGLNVNQPGRFKDPRSGDYFSVSPEGEIEFYEMKKIKLVDVKVPCDAVFDSSLASLADTVVSAVGLPGDVSEEIGQAITNAWIIVSKNAKDSNETCNVLIVGDEDKIQVGFLNYDTALNFPANDPSLGALQQCVDEVKHLTLPTRGHLLTMIKKKA